jgi:hypothetical protein
VNECLKREIPLITKELGAETEEGGDRVGAMVPPTKSKTKKI